MVKVLFDTNIFIDYLNTVPQARAEFDRYVDIGISSVSWIEVMVGANASTEVDTRRFLAQFTTVPLDQEVAEQAVVLRRRYRLKLADAVSWASAQVAGRLFVTRDAKDFAHDVADIRIPYRL